MANSPVNFIHVLVLQVWYFVLSKVPESLQGVETSTEMVEYDSQDLHEGHVIKFEDSSLSNVDLDIPALNSCTSKNDSVLLFTVLIDNPHPLSTDFAFSCLR